MSYWGIWINDFPHWAVGASEFVLAFCGVWRLTRPTSSTKICRATTHEGPFIPPPSTGGQTVHAVNTPDVSWIEFQNARGRTVLGAVQRDALIRKGYTVVENWLGEVVRIDPPTTAWTPRFTYEKIR